MRVIIKVEKSRNKSKVGNIEVSDSYYSLDDNNNILVR
jgi:hypothetical protein